MKRVITLVCVLLLIGAFSGAQEKKMMKEADPEHELEMSVERGKGLFMDASLGTTGMSCNSCHVEGGMKAGAMGDKEIPPFAHTAKKYPRWFAMAGRVMTLDQVINWCIMKPMEGAPLAWDDQRLTDLAAYVASVNAMKGEKTMMEKEKMKEKMKEEKKKTE